MNKKSKIKEPHCCDVCGKPATHLVRDVLEKPNTEKVYREFAPSTQVRAGCDDHPVTSKTYEQ